MNSEPTSSVVHFWTPADADTTGTAIEFAQRAALKGENVVIVDASITSPSVRWRMKLPEINDLGLLELLDYIDAEPADIAACVQRHLFDVRGELGLPTAKDAQTQRVSILAAGLWGEYADKTAHGRPGRVFQSRFDENILPAHASKFFKGMTMGLLNSVPANTMVIVDAGGGADTLGSPLMRNLGGPVVMLASSGNDNKHLFSAARDLTNRPKSERPMEQKIIVACETGDASDHATLQWMNQLATMMPNMATRSLSEGLHSGGRPVNERLLAEREKMYELIDAVMASRI